MPSAGSGAKPLRLLILGGSFEGRILANTLSGRSDLLVISSLAGRTAAPLALPGMVRKGGFGGADGFCAYLRDAAIDAVVIATHPFAAQISERAKAVCAALGLPHLHWHRPAWTRLDGDLWTEVADEAEAAASVPGRGKRVLLALGAQRLAPFEDLAGIWFLIRSIEPMADAPKNALWISARGPFSTEAEVALMRRHRIDLVVARASGGEAGYGKIAAARILKLPVILIRRPKIQGPVVHDLKAVLSWIEALRTDMSQSR